jgi:hypothetical protein
MAATAADFRGAAIILYLTQSWPPLSLHQRIQGKLFRLAVNRQLESIRQERLKHAHRLLFRGIARIGNDIV